MKSSLNTMALVATLLCAGSAQAALTTYANRAEFNTANAGTSTEGFESVNSIEEVLAGININSNVSFALTSGINAYLAAPGQSANSSQAIGVNIPLEAGWKITFNTGVNAVGLDIFQNFGGGNQSGSTIFATVDVFGINGLLGTFNASVPSGEAGFAGFGTGSELISYLTINNVASYDVIDNVSFALAGGAEVPEPSTFALLGLGIAGLAYRRKFKKA